MNVFDPKNSGPIRPGLFEKYIDQLTKIRNAIQSSKGDDAYVHLKELYDYVKIISPDFVFEDDKIRSNFARIAKFVEDTEETLPNDFLIQPSIQKFRDIKITPESKPEEILEFIVAVARKRLCHTIGFENDISKFEVQDLRRQCQGMSFFIGDLAKYLGYKVAVKVIEPGYLISSHLYIRGGDHAFVLIYFEDRCFLIDCTYSQFFLVKRCLIEKTGIMRVKNAQAGYFMMLTEERKKVAEKLLRDGWIELTGDTLKHYLDGFTLSYRNGIYYEKTDDFSFTTPYTVDTYMDFISYCGDMLDYEKEETLGYQYRPLKNPKMKFHN